MTNPCAVCARPTDATICTRCAGEIVDALNGLSRDLADLVAIETRQASGPLGVRNDGRFGECEDPDRDPTFRVIGENRTELRGWEGWMWSPGASLQRDYIANTVSTWARHIAETNRIDIDLRPPRVFIVNRRGRAHLRRVPQVELVARWLIDHIALVRRDEAAAVIHDEITGLAQENDRAILGRAGTDEFYGLCDRLDVKVEMLTLHGPRCGGFGDCGHESCRAVRDGEPVLRTTPGICGAQLYAHPDADKVKCGACGETYAAAERKRAMRAQLPDSLGTFVEIASALTKLDAPVTVHALESAVRRRQIPERGRTARGQILVRVGDVEAYLERVAARRAKGGKIAS